MKNIEFYYQIIENCIKRLGVDPAICKGEKPGQWDLKKGSASVWIDVWKKENEDYGYMQIMAPISEIPATGKEAFYEEVLTINHDLYGVGFTKFENWIYIKIIRELEDLSEDEAFAMFNRIGNYADQYDDHFKDKYFSTGNRG
jgi:hypothetical protein